MKGATVVTSPYRDLLGAIYNIDFPHHELHEGNHYTVSDVVQLASGASRELLIENPANSVAHMLVMVSNSLDTTTTFYEATTKTTGTLKNIRNNNRISVNVSALTVSHTPAGAGVGNILIQERTGSATVAGSGNFRSRGDNEWILAPSTKYLLNVTSNANNNNVSIILAWYEPD